MVVRKSRVVPIECVVREVPFGVRMEGYQQSGSIAGWHCRPDCGRATASEPIFAPATKEERPGHQYLVRADGGTRRPRTVRLACGGVWRSITRRRTAPGRGIAIADTKFEFGHADDELLLIDEV